MTTINVLDSAGLTVAIEKPLPPARAAAAASRPVALSTEDKASLDAVASQTTAAAILVQETAIATALGVAADAASATTTISAKLRGIATALGVTALDLGTGTAGSRTLRFFQDTAQWIGGAGAVGSAVQRTTLASDDPAVAVLGTTAGAAVTMSVAGTIQGYLRGIVSLLVSGITVAAHAVTQSGTWTVQPGNTANTTAWKMDGSAVTQPVSAVSLPLPSGAATAAKQPALGTAGTPSADVLSMQGVVSGTPIAVDREGTRTTYRAMMSVLAVTTSGVIFQIQGSGTKTVKVRRFAFSGVGTAAGVMSAHLERSTSTATGTATAVTPAKLDSNNATATAAVVTIPTPTGVGAGRTFLCQAQGMFGGGTIVPTPFEFQFADFGAQALVLRGTSEFVGVNVIVASGTYTSASFSGFIEWTEE